MTLKKLKKKKKNKFIIKIRKTNKHIYLILYSSFSKRIITTSSTLCKYLKNKNNFKMTDNVIKEVCKNLVIKIYNLNIKGFFIDIGKNKYHGKIKLICELVSFFFNEYTI
ncbi:50S ribosomal protein L18 [Candidatus Vidania fulgoroideorum]